MRDSLREKLEEACRHHEELRRRLEEKAAQAGHEELRLLGREMSRLTPLVECYAEYQKALAQLQEAASLCGDKDPEMRQLAEEIRASNRQQLEHLEEQLHTLLLPSDYDADTSFFLEIRAGTGGTEAALFAGDLFRMYQRYSEAQGWKCTIVSCRPGEQGGFREIVCRLSGPGSYGALHFESGTHRVQRIPQTESQGRIHTSACTVAILPEISPAEEIPLARDQLRIDTFRAPSAGGQHVNKTDSAVRITHLPSGLAVACHDERSHPQTKARAMALLQARLHEKEHQRLAQEQADKRRHQVGSGDRSERIRTYNFPQGRITDHRIPLSLHNLPAVLEGELQELVQALGEHDRSQRLTELHTD